MSALPTLTATRQMLLQVLWEYKYMTTGQIHSTVLGHVHRNTAYRQLIALRKLSLVTSHSCTPDRGEASEFYWLLTKKGAETIGHAAEFGKHYRRRPERERLLHQSIALEFEKNVYAAGWQLCKPVVYSRAHPHPTFAQMVNGEGTDQVHTLIAVISESEERAIQEMQNHDPYNPELARRIRAYDAESYISAVYAAAPNDYLAYVTGATARANIMILCPPNAAERFWLKRIARYTRLLRYVKIFAVFANQTQATAHMPALQGSGLEIRTVAALAKAGQNTGDG